MSAAWQDALVVRDRLGQLRHAGGFLDEPIGSGLDPLEAAAFADTFGPMVPILGRTGLPIVRTVGDITARHGGKRVRVRTWAGELLLVQATAACVDMVLEGRPYPHQLCLSLDTPCEVLS